MKFISKFKVYIALVIIIILAAFAYFYKLDKIPSGFYVDEASVAYNARSILETGKDEYGYKDPIYFRLMGSYSPSFFIYLSSFAIKFFGSSPIVFRSITAIFVLVSVFFFYLFAKNLGLYKNKLSYLLITLFFAISPWIVFNARLGYETTLGFVFFGIGTYFLFRAIKEGNFLVWGITFLSISTYTSHNQRFLSPLYLVCYAIVFRSSIFTLKNRKNLINSFFVGFLSQIPNLLMIGTSAFWIKNVQFDLKYFWNFLKYLSPKTLFWDSSDIDLQHTVPRMSVMYDWMAIPYLIGIYLVVKRIKENSIKFVIMSGVVTLIPAVFSGYFLSTQRALNFAIPLTIIIGLGIDSIITFLKKPLIVWLVVVSVITYSIAALTVSYFILFPKERADAWNYGYNKVASYIKNNPSKSFLFDSTRNPRAYILLLYFLNIPPKDYQAVEDPYFRDNYYKAPSPADVYKFSNVEVRSIDWKNDPQKDLYIIGDNLSVSDDQKRSHQLTEVDTIKNDLNENIFIIFKTGGTLDK